MDREMVGVALRVAGLPEVPGRVVLGDPVFRGLHDYEDAGLGRSYRTTMHVNYPWHLRKRPLAERMVTLSLPGSPSDNWTHVVHEIGHMVNYHAGFPVDLPPVTAYAARDSDEAFAEAFSAFLIPGYLPWDPSAVELRRDELSVSIFRALGFAPWWERTVVEAEPWWIRTYRRWS